MICCQINEDVILFISDIMSFFHEVLEEVNAGDVCFWINHNSDDIIVQNMVEWNQVHVLRVCECWI